jgi:pilus assembly protein CpaB
MFGRFAVVGLASLALACGIALIFYKVLGSSDERKKLKTRGVVVASAELPVGTRIRTQDIRIVGVPEELASPSSLDKVDLVKDRIVTSLILKDEPVMASRLAPPGSGPGLAPMIPSGYRAVSVRVNDVIGVAGFIQPGMRVDVLASGRLPNSEDSVTRTVLQNVMVLTAGQVLQPEPKGQVINAQVVTLQVRPDEAEVLTLTSGEGRIQLVLRNSSDTAVAPTPGAHLKAIYSAGTEPVAPKVTQAVARHFEPVLSAPPKLPVPVPPPPPAHKRTVEVIRGTTRSDVPTPETEKNGGTDVNKTSRQFYAAPIFS